MLKRRKTITLAEYDRQQEAKRLAEYRADMRNAAAAQASSRVWDDPKNWR